MYICVYMCVCACACACVCVCVCVKAAVLFFEKSKACDHLDGTASSNIILPLEQ